jgi:hypothetical protein
MYLASLSWLHKPSGAIVDKQTDARWDATRFFMVKREWRPTLPEWQAAASGGNNACGVTQRSSFMPEIPPTIEFDETRAMRYSPKKELLLVRIIEKPADEVTVIEIEPSIRETIVGTYVETLNPETNDLKCAFNYDEFLNTHTPWEGVENGWYWSDPVDAYQADAEGELLIEIKGKTQHVNVDDWLYRMQDGRVRCLKDWQFELLYDLESARPIPQEPE